MGAVAPWLLCLFTGCAALPSGGFTPPWRKAETKVVVPKDSVVLTDRGLEREVIDPGLRQQMDGAKYLFDSQKYAEAEVIFHKLATPDGTPWWDLGSLLSSGKSDDEKDADGAKKSKDDKDKAKEKDKKKKAKIPITVREFATFYEAESQRMQKNYRSAVDTYTKLLVDFPHSQYTPGSCRGLFEIADYWLEPTRKQMDEYQEQLKGKRTFVMPAMYVHFNKDMPMLDSEGNALLILNTVRLHDIKGRLGEKSLLYLGTIHFYRKDYKEADFYFTQLHQEYPNSEDAPKAIKQSVICKQLSTGGSVYDCRPVQESKTLLMMAQSAYPQLANDKKWIESQLVSINIQQADRDYKVAQFYQRTKHPGAAYFYYELVRRRYPGTTYSTQAALKMNEIRTQVEKEQAKAKAAATPATPPAPAPTGQATQSPVVNPPPRTLPPALTPGLR